jgi:twinkle protein
MWRIGRRAALSTISFHSRPFFPAFTRRPYSVDYSQPQQQQPAYEQERQYQPRSNFARRSPPKALGLLHPSELIDAARTDWLNENERLEKGPKLATLPKLGNILGPFRDGELTIFTGPTGTGKTTVLSQISLDYAAQRVGTLWGSFEIQNPRLVRVMLQQVAETPPALDQETGRWSMSEEALQKSCQLLSLLPIGFLDVHGSTATEDVLSAMHRAAMMTDSAGNRVYRHIILDNLQFMLSSQYTSSLDKFDLSDRVMAALRHFATSTNCHVTLVIHPRKEADDVPLGLSSVSGTAKATQEADNVIILQKLFDRRFLDVKKNRFTGELGRVEISYNPAKRLVYELSEEDFKNRKDHPEGGAV